MQSHNTAKDLVKVFIPPFLCPGWQFMCSYVYMHDGDLDLK